MSMALIAGVAATGCVDSAQPVSTESADPTANHILITGRDALSGIPWQTAQYQWTADGHEVTASGPGWTQTAPGVWTNSAHGITTTMKIVSVQNTLGLPPPPLTCNLAHYIGPSSPIVPDFVGEAAVGQVDCIDGTGRVFINTEACSDLVPNCASDFEVGNASPGAPFTVGVAVAGTAGVDCSGHVAFFPPSFSGSNPCG
jgi:hypothetical protein